VNINNEHWVYDPETLGKKRGFSMHMTAKLDFIRNGYSVVIFIQT
jgi:hypothetical protein